MGFFLTIHAVCRTHSTVRLGIAFSFRPDTDMWHAINAVVVVVVVVVVVIAIVVVVFIIIIIIIIIRKSTKMERPRQMDLPPGNDRKSRAHRLNCGIQSQSAVSALTSSR